MATNVYSIAIDQITDTTVRLGVTYVSGAERGETVTLVLREAESGYQAWYNDNIEGPREGTEWPTIQPSGLTPGTLYEVELIDYASQHQTAYFWTTGGTQSYTATIGQWQDLVGKVNSTLTAEEGSITVQSSNISTPHLALRKVGRVVWFWGYFTVTNEIAVAGQMFSLPASFASILVSGDSPINALFLCNPSTGTMALAAEMSSGQVLARTAIPAGTYYMNAVWLSNAD